MVNNNNNNKLISILAYFLIGIIWFFVDEKVKKSEIVKFHVKQALNLIIIDIVGSIIIMVIPFVPLFVGRIFGLFIFVLAVIGIINAVKQNKSEIPLIGSFASNYLNF